MQDKKKSDHSLTEDPDWKDCCARRIYPPHKDFSIIAHLCKKYTDPPCTVLCKLSNLTASQGFPLPDFWDLHKTYNKLSWFGGLIPVCLKVYTVDECNISSVWDRLYLKIIVKSVIRCNQLITTFSHEHFYLKCKILKNLRKLVVFLKNFNRLILIVIIIRD